MSGDHQSLIGFFAGSLCCLAAFDCNQSFDKYGGILAWIALMLYMFKALGTICDEYFVPSLEVIVQKLQLSNDVAGATFMAAGSSAPELFTSLVATFLIVNEGGVGTIVGSAIFNILVICGATGIIACKDQDLKIWWYPLCRDCFFYCLSITELMIILSNEHVELYEGLIMIFTYISYCIYMKFNPAIVRMLGIRDPSCQTIVSTVEDGSTAVQIKVAECNSLMDSGEGPPREAAQKIEVEDTNGATEKPEETALRSLGSSEAGEASQEARQPEVGGRENPGVVNTPEEDTKEVSVDSDEAAGETSTDKRQERPSTDKSPERPSTMSQNSSLVPELLEPAAQSPREQRRPSWGYAESNVKGKRGSSKEGVEIPAPLCVAPDVEDPPKGLFGIRFLQDPLNVFWELTMPNPEKMGGGMLFGLSIAFIGLCTYVMVDSTNRVGVILHIPPLAMALVFLAAGTSIPDALGSIAVAKQGEGDMAIANALGSNVFDILIGLGVPWTIKTAMGKEVSFIGKWDELIYDIWVLVFVLILFVGCLAVHKWYLTRRVGVLLIMCYGLFLIYNVFAIWILDPPLKEQAEQGHCDTI